MLLRKKKKRPVQARPRILDGVRIDPEHVGEPIPGPDIYLGQALLVVSEQKVSYLHVNAVAEEHVAEHGRVYRFDQHWFLPVDRRTVRVKRSRIGVVTGRPRSVTLNTELSHVASLREELPAADAKSLGADVVLMVGSSFLVGTVHEIIAVDPKRPLFVGVRTTTHPTVLVPAASTRVIPPRL